MSNGIKKGLSGGELTVDPTENVKALQEASNRRQDDLRVESLKHIDSELKRLEQKIDMSISQNKEMRVAETERLNSIRTVDVGNVITANIQSQAAITALAVTTTNNAENIRNTMITTAATVAKQTADSFAQITDRLSVLERMGYEGQGKAGIRDPQIDELIRTFKESQGTKTQGVENMWQKILQAAVLIGIVLDIILHFK